MKAGSSESLDGNCRSERQYEAGLNAFRCWRVNIRALLACLVLLAFCGPLPVQSGTPAFGYQASLDANAHRVDGSLLLELRGEEAVFNAGLVVQSANQVVRLAGPATWQPGERHDFQLQLQLENQLPGSYKLLLAVEYQDSGQRWHSYPFAADYSVGPPHDMPLRTPDVTLKGGQLSWQLSGLSPDNVSLGLSATPFWEDLTTLLPKDPSFRLVPRPDRAAPAGRVYPQLARLDWREQGVHYSKLIPWSIRTDQQGRWLDYTGDKPRHGWWRSGYWLQLASITVALLALMWTLAVFRRAEPPLQSSAEPRLSRHLGWLLVAGLTLWVADHTRLDLWPIQTWTTGGDTASHILYANVFRDWLAHGKISGWMPEVFMGFPAFSYYFPMPFVLGIALSGLVGMPVAFKLIAMLPAIMLPLATYTMATLLRWPVAARLLGAAGAAGFVLTTGTSIWGGNLMAQMAGEFAYSWGLFWTVIFWGVLGRAINTGGRVWILAALLEVVVAFSHGYALLAAGFGAFFFPLLYRNWRQGLLVVLQVHTLAFLLLGFWLIPLISNLPWTIPNDTSMWVERWQTLWPRQLWPLFAAIPYLVIALVISKSARVGLGLPLGICVFGLMTFHAAHQLGLADIRFFPFAQWGLAVALAGGVGWLLYRWVPVSLLWSCSVVLALMAWWEPDTAGIENWARWNLEGYEVKATWPAYRSVADTLAGDLQDPRVLFEHDPDNHDMGSTRTVEAMPLFGTRPVLEGLYMESAISSAFIYQLQAETSHRPSSPLSRFPSSKGSVDDAIHHMNELYTDTLVLRSAQMKQRYRNDARFEVVAETEPFLVLKLKQPESQLVDIVDVPLEIRSRDKWMDSAFRRFRLAHPYDKRQVYVSPEQTWQETAAATGGAVRVLEMDRERLVFETDAVGQPHVVRMTYNPKWKSMTGEPIFLTEPAFMLVVPQQSRVELQYATSAPDTVGFAFTLTGIAGLVLVLLVPGLSPAPVVARGPGALSTTIVLVVALTVSLWTWWTNPERTYKHGHAYLSEDQFDLASQAFDRAYEGRHVPGKKAEALFWAARASEFMGDNKAALERYTSLASLYPDNFWAAESLYRIVMLQSLLQDNDAAAKAYRQLQKDFPDNRWARKATSEFRPLQQ
jgi:hypothetical protein